MKVKFDYGKTGLDIEIDPNWKATVFKPKKQTIIENPIKSLKEAIQNPISTNSLKEIINSRKKTIKQVCIVVSDATRPVPSRLIVEALVQILNETGINDEKILILVATGLHRPSREEEFVRILGADLNSRLKVIDHDASDKDSLIELGVTQDGIPIQINKHYVNSDLKIITGYVEPHFFAGFAGGRKTIIPGIAGEETIQNNHSASNIASSYARFGIYEQNPIHQHSLEGARKVGVDFCVNVCINENHEIIKIAAGYFEKVHEFLVAFQLETVFREIDDYFDIVICGNGGFPLDLNLYQAVKSMAIGEMAVKEGGTIISVNECSDGIGIGQDKFKELIYSGLKPGEIYEKLFKKEIVVPDQWEIQVLARVLMKAEVFLVSSLDKDGIGNIGLKHSSTVEEAIKKSLEKHGKGARILLLPNGPQVLPKCTK